MTEGIEQMIDEIEKMPGPLSLPTRRLLKALRVYRDAVAKAAAPRPQKGWGLWAGQPSFSAEDFKQNRREAWGTLADDLS